MNGYNEQKPENQSYVFFVLTWTLTSRSVFMWKCEARQQNRTSLPQLYTRNVRFSPKIKAQPKF